MKDEYYEEVYTCFSIPMKEHEFEQAEAIIDEISDQYEDVWNIATSSCRKDGYIVLHHNDDTCNLGVLVKLTQTIVDSLHNPDPVSIRYTDESGCTGGKVTIRKNMEPEFLIPQVEVNY